MAFTPTVTWNAAFNDTPAGSDDPRAGDDRIRELKDALYERLSREMYFGLTGGSSNGQEGNFRAGAGRAYYQEAAPTTKPDGNTLDADDYGRLWFQSSTNILKINKAGTFVDPSAGSLIETGASTQLFMKVVNIGDWNMDSTASVSVAHGLTLSKIVGLRVLIRGDTGLNAIYPLDYNTEVGATTTIAGWFYVSGANVILNRLTGGSFDGTDWNETSYNRGWIMIWYTA